MDTRRLNLKRNLEGLSGLLRERGVGGAGAYYAAKFKLFVSGYQRSVKIDGCRFNLVGVTREPRAELLAGVYEGAERACLSRYIRSDLPVIELGASIGVIACLTNKRLHYPAAHVVLEANPVAIEHLENNKRKNGCSFRIVPKALAYDAATVTFRPSSNLCASSLAAEGDSASITVRATQLGVLVRESGFRRFSLICDVEGMEYELVTRELEVLRGAQTIILETHARFIGQDRIATILDRLAEVGFRIVEELGYVVVLQQ